MAAPDRSGPSQTESSYEGKGLLFLCAENVQWHQVTTAAKHEIASTPPGVLLETRVRGFTPKNANGIGLQSPASSTLRWGSWQIYDRTPVGSLVGLDYFGPRFYSGAQGRFTSPDPPFLDQSPGSPQSWNLYSYVRNNPLRFSDPTGRTCQKMSNGTPYDDMDGQGCAEVDEANKTKKPDVTVGVGWDEARLFMLAGIGDNFSSPHQLAVVAQNGILGAMTVDGLRSIPSLFRLGFSLVRNWRAIT